MDRSFNHDMEAQAAEDTRCYGFGHVVKKGDTLYKLSKQYHVKVSALILANPYVNIYNLQVGDTICIPRVRPIVVPVPPYPPVRPYPSSGFEMPEHTEQEPSASEEMPKERMEETVAPQEDSSGGSEFSVPEQPEQDVSEQEMAPARESCVPACANLEKRVDTMTVKELLEEWDITYPMLASCLNILKKNNG